MPTNDHRMKSYPCAYRERRMVRIDLDNAPHAWAVEGNCVLDMDEFDEIIGVEIIGLQEAVGAKIKIVEHLVGEPRVDEPRIAYDSDHDILYVTIESKRAPSQQNGIVEMRVDQNRLVRLTATLAD